MKKIFFITASVLLYVSICSGGYLTQPLHSDKGVGAVMVQDEKVVHELLKTSETDRNIVLNYIKTVLFTEGFVLVEQEKAFREVMERLSAEDRKKLEEIINLNLSEKKIKTKAIDINSRDYYLPINLSDGE